MCGIAGLWSQGNDLAVAWPALGTVLSVALAHRGPDDFGQWHDANAGLLLVHTRLAIQDLSDAGAQPMASRSGRFIVVFNGEIYNHLSLRLELSEAGKAPVWRGHSDTETLLASVEAWGLSQAVKKFRGMFAFGLWDRKLQRLSLCRDRLGEKPLYYGRVGKRFAFASELTALLGTCEAKLAIDPEAVRIFTSYGYVPEPYSIFRGIKKVPPGQIVHVPHAKGDVEIEKYWCLGEVLDFDVETHEFDKEHQDDTPGATEAILKETISSQALSDVPLGTFLSGGVDSSLVTALLQNVSEKPVLSFSIGFEEAAYDESQHAAAVARHLGTRHTEFKVNELDALAIVPDLARIYDEPFADSSQIPTVLLSRLARNEVTVALTGDGGDEVFGGYNRYIFAPKAWERASRLPIWARRNLGYVAHIFSQLGGANNVLLRAAAKRVGLPITSVNKIAYLGAALADAQTESDLYASLTRVGPGNDVLLPDLRMTLEDNTDEIFALSELTFSEWMMAMDTVTYLPGDILVKVDRAAMSTSLETRAPFLDHHIVEHAWKLPLEEKINGGSGKITLRRILDRHVPRELIERPKQGFAVPLDTWLRGALRDWAESLIEKDKLVTTGVFEPNNVRSLWNKHQSGKSDLASSLWPILMFMSWHDNIQGSDMVAGKSI